MTSITTDFVDEHLINNFINNLMIPNNQGEMEEREKEDEMSAVVENDGVCAICMDHIELKEMALLKGCEHAYCVNCILQWAMYHEHPKCPQCKNPFESLSVHRALDGSLHDSMLEESVCLLVRASWFKPLDVEPQDDFYDDFNDIFYYQYQYQYEYEDLIDEDLEDAYFDNSSSLRIGNRRWGDNGYISAGRQEARPVHRSNPQNSGECSSSRQRKQKEVEKDSDVDCFHTPKKVGKDLMGRRAKRALKREAADKAAAVKHQQHLARLGRQ